MFQAKKVKYNLSAAIFRAQFIITERTIKARVAAARRTGTFFSGGSINFSIPVQQMYNPKNARTFTNINDSRRRLKTWHKKKGISEYAIILKEI